MSIRYTCDICLKDTNNPNILGDAYGLLSTLGPIIYYGDGIAYNKRDDKHLCSDCSKKYREMIQVWILEQKRIYEV